MENVNLENIVQSDLNASSSLASIQERPHANLVLGHALENPSISSFKKNGKLPKKFYDQLKKNSRELSYDPHFRRIMSNGDSIDVRERWEGRDADSIIYDSPGRFYPYKKALGEGEKALLKISPFLVGGYFADKYLSNPLPSPTGILKYFTPLAPFFVAKDLARVGGSLVWNSMKTPLLGLAGIYVLYKTIRGYFKGRKEVKERKKYKNLETSLSDLNDQRYDLIKNMIIMGS